MKVHEIPIGSMLIIGECGDRDIIWRKISDQQDLIADKRVGVLEFDQVEFENKSRARREHGNNFFPHSNIFQWLNATEQDHWYRQQHEFDEAPYYTGSPGFLSGFMSAELAALVERSITVAVPLGSRKQFGREYQMKCRVCLPAATEVGLTDPELEVEGAAIPEIRNMLREYGRNGSMMTRTGVRDAAHILAYYGMSCETISAARSYDIRPMIRLKADTELIQIDDQQTYYCIQTDTENFQNEFLKIIAI